MLLTDPNMSACLAAYTPYYLLIEQHTNAWTQCLPWSVACDSSLVSWQTQECNAVIFLKAWACQVTYYYCSRHPTVLTPDQLQQLSPGLYINSHNSSCSLVYQLHCWLPSAGNPASRNQLRLHQHSYAHTHGSSAQLACRLPAHKPGPNRLAVTSH